MAKIDLDRVPRTLTEAVDMLFSELDEKEIEFIKTHEPGEVHFTAGMPIRNDWSLWEKETILVKWFQKNYKVGHADDISGLILTALWQKVNGKSIDLTEEVERYHKHWKKNGCDPLTGDRAEY